MKNNGKRFEQNIKASCEKQGILFERFIDGNKFGGGGADKCEVCPYSNNHDNKRKDFCDLDIHERHLWCILEEIE